MPLCLLSSGLRALLIQAPRGIPHSTGRTEGKAFRAMDLDGLRLWTLTVFARGPSPVEAEPWVVVLTLGRIRCLKPPPVTPCKHNPNAMSHEVRCRLDERSQADTQEYYLVQPQRPRVEAEARIRGLSTFVICRDFGDSTSKAILVASVHLGRSGTSAWPGGCGPQSHKEIPWRTLRPPEGLSSSGC
jgi:hypothetical protein